MTLPGDPPERNPAEAPRSHPGALLSEGPEPIGELGGALAPEDAAGRYVRLEELERTPQAVLWLCKDAQTRRTVVMKELDSSDALARRLFLREARIQAQLEHPGIVPIYDLGIEDSKRLFFTMQQLNGKSLRTVLERLNSGDDAVRERFSRDRLLDVFRQLCLTVDYIHESSVIHRSIKPENVILGDFGEVKLVDWSLARVITPPSSAAEVSLSAESDTAQAAFPAAPGYASPEQLLCDPNVDRRADVYALGAILFEILTLERLHAGATPPERLRSTITGSGETRASVRAPHRAVPPELELACIHATALRRTDRHATARELYEVVDRFLEADRDIQQRLLLARRHSELAEEAASLVGGPDDIEHRRRALREIGRALALDATSAGAHRALMTVFREEPAKMPPEAASRFAREQAAQARAAARFGQFAYLAFAVPIATLVFSGIKSWLGFSLLFGSVLAAAASCAMLARTKKPTIALLFPIFGFSSLAVAMSSGLYGSLVLTPALVVANTLVLDIARLRKYRWLVLCFGASCVLIPFSLERLGILPQSYIFSEESIAILPVIRAFPEHQVRIGLFLTSLMIIVLPTLFLWRTSDTLSALRKRLYVQKWQLSRLLPEDTAGKNGLALEDGSLGTGGGR